ncbi:hypothetical protein OXX80_008657 [Metschnikowia pulcherrima]
MSEITTSNAQIVKSIKNRLQEHGALDKSRKIVKTGSTYHIYALTPIDRTSELLNQHGDEISLDTYANAAPSEDQSLPGHVGRYLEQHLSADPDNTKSALLASLPKKWSLYPPMVLFGTGSFDSEIWTSAFKCQINKAHFFKSIAKAFPGKFTHFAINKPIIEDDVMRRPFNLIPLWGDFGPEPTPDLYSNPTESDLRNAFWCNAVQNGIRQTWAPRYTMFSRGNIKEKKRILDSYDSLHGKAVLDLYAGIGYFTLSYLANGATVFCWEINPWSIEGLVRGLQENHHLYKIFRSDAVVTQSELLRYMAQGVKAFVFHESNEKAPKRLAQLRIDEISHINLGLLPSSKPSWHMARDFSNTKGDQTIVHVHENAHKDTFSELIDEIEKVFSGNVLHLEKVKTFAPDIWHVVVDVAVGVM